MDTLSVIVGQISMGGRTTVGGKTSFEKDFLGTSTTNKTTKCTWHLPEVCTLSLPSGYPRCYISPDGEKIVPLLVFLPSLSLSVLTWLSSCMSACSGPMVENMMHLLCLLPKEAQNSPGLT